MEDTRTQAFNATHPDSLSNQINDFLREQYSAIIIPKYHTFLRFNKSITIFDYFKNAYTTSKAWWMCYSKIGKMPLSNLPRS